MKNFINWIYILFFIGAFSGVLNTLYATSGGRVALISEDSFPKPTPSKFVFNSSHTQEELESLDESTKFKCLDLRAISSNLAPLALFRKRVPSVEELYIGRMSFVEQILETLPKCMPALSILVLNNSSVTSSYFQHFHSLQALKILSLAQASITEEEHVNELLQKNSNLLIYIDPLKYPPESISLSTFRDESRVVKSMYNVKGAK